MKIYDVCGIGNGIMDILVKVTDQEFQSLGLQRGSATLVDIDFQQNMLERFKNHMPVLASGGSVANSIFGVAQLGGKAALLTSLGDDRYGLHFVQECTAAGIELGNSLTFGATTGTCLVFITPDSERTMCTCLGVSAALSGSHIKEEIVSQSKWIFIEGYLMANTENGHQAVNAAVKLARESQCKIALTMSDDWIIGLQPDFARKMAAEADLVFANEKEALALTKTANLDQAVEKAKSMLKNFVFTASEKGARMSFGGKDALVPAFVTEPKDLTGAGDAFAAGFLYGINNKVAPADAVRGGCYLASKVIARVGARLHSGTKEYWDECLSG